MDSGLVLIQMPVLVSWQLDDILPVFEMVLPGRCFDPCHRRACNRAEDAIRSMKRLLDLCVPRLFVINFVINSCRAKDAHVTNPSRFKFRIHGLSSKVPGIHPEESAHVKRWQSEKLAKGARQTQIIE